MPTSPIEAGLEFFKGDRVIVSVNLSPTGLANQQICSKVWTSVGLSTAKVFKC